FCWGYCDRPETLGALVRAAIACNDIATAFGTPFISGKDSLNNEFTYESRGERRTIQIPHTLLISALGQVADVAHCVTMDLKSAGNSLYQIGATKHELAGSHFGLVTGNNSGRAPPVDAPAAKLTFAVLHEAIGNQLARACHDLSEGGLAVALAEMAFAGGLGADICLAHVPADAADSQSAEADIVRLFSESASRFLVEVTPDNQKSFESALQSASVPF